MSRIVLASLIACFLISGIAVSPFFSGKVVGDAYAQGVTRHVTLIANEKVVQVAPDNFLHPGGVKYNAMVFNGSIPGPVVAINQGDTLNITLKNEGKLIHSIDFHAGYGPGQALSGNVKAGESHSWLLHGIYPGVFFYHCGADSLNGIWEHIASGMYGGIVVHPTNEQPAKEFYMVMSEIYGNINPATEPTNTTASFDLKKLLYESPDLVLTNGESFKYVPAIGQAVKIPLNANATVFKVKPGELTRWYIVNPGPNDGLAFHFISGILSVRDGANALNNNFGMQDRDDETWWIPAGSASVIESTFPTEGLYVGVDHAMKDVVKGGAFAVVGAANSTATDHPPGTNVPLAPAA